MKHTVKITAFFFLMLTGCTSTSYEKNNIPDTIGGDSNSLILNYENRVREYSESNIDSHMRIYIEIEKPHIISIPSLNGMEKIYSITPIEGTAVFRAVINNKGKIVSSKNVLSAGLGLDELAEDIFKQIKVESAYLAGRPDNSTADIKIQFKADGRE